jgi:hypothetical protein
VLHAAAEKESVIEFEEVEGKDGRGNGDVSIPLLAPTVPRPGQWFCGAWAKEPATLKAKKDFWAKDCWNTCDYPSECRWGKQYGVQTPEVPCTPSTRAEERAKASGAATFDDVLMDTWGPLLPVVKHLEQMVVDKSECVVAKSTSARSREGDKKPSMDDLVASVKRRKRKSDGALPSTLGSNPSPPMTTEEPLPTQTTLLREEAALAASYQQKAFNDFESDVKKSFGGCVAGWAGARR